MSGPRGSRQIRIRRIQRMKNLATTYAAESRRITLTFSDRDLWRYSLSGKSAAGQSFFSEIGVWENHSVAHGQNTTVWIEVGIREPERSASRLSVEVGESVSFSKSYLEPLLHFLKEQGVRSVAVRHHFAWWYPKWVDRLRAALQ